MKTDETDVSIEVDIEHALVYTYLFSEKGVDCILASVRFTVLMN